MPNVRTRGPATKPTTLSSNMRTRESSESPSMAEKLAEDDDDDGFGDFKFASYSTPQIDNIHASAHGGGDDDEEWGDFVNNSSPAPTSEGNPPSSSFTRTQSLPTSSDPSRIFDPFGSFSGKSLDSMPAAPWVKPRGVLPLSIFGGIDEEEELEEGFGSPEAKSEIGDVRNIFAQKQGSKVGVAINDVIADLYGQMEQIKAPVGSNLGLSGTTTNYDSTVYVSDLNDASSKVNGFEMGMGGLNLESVDGDGDFEDDDGWEFKGADMGTKEHGASELSGLKVQFPISDHEMQEDLDKVLHASGFGNGNGSHVSTDLFSMSNGFTEKATEFGTRLDLKPIITTQNGLEPNSFIKGMNSATNNGVESHPLDENVDSDDDNWEFKDAIASSRSMQESVWAMEDAPVETNLKQEKEPKAVDISTGGFQALTLNGETPGSEINSENKGALPLSIFSDGIPDTDDSFNHQDFFVYTPASSKKAYNTGSNMPINDLILNLYSQAEEICSNDSTQKPIKNGLNSTLSVLNTDLINSDDEFEDSSWEFKDAFAKIGDEDRNSLSPCNGDGKSIATFQLNDYVGFYTQLKEQLCFVVQHHMGTHKSSNGSALSEKEGGIVASDEEFQEACKILQQFVPEEFSLGSRPSRNIGLKEFVEVLHQPKFLELDSEYHLSRSLLLAEQGLKPAIELLKHAAAMLKIPRMGSIEEQSSYAFTWLKVASICAQELKHGAFIWKQSLQKNLHGQLLCKPPGQKFIHALGEIYRVSQALGASTKLYKPWMLLGYADFTAILALLDECSTLWSSSGLQEALQSMSQPTSLDLDGNTISALLRSIEYIHDLGAISLQSLVFSQPETMCKFSLLTPGAVPGMKMVDWNGERYFLAVANLWANLISCEPPKLANLRSGLGEMMLTEH